VRFPLTRKSSSVSGFLGLPDTEYVSTVARFSVDYGEILGRHEAVSANREPEVWRRRGRADKAPGGRSG